MNTDQQIIIELSRNKAAGLKSLFDCYYRPMCVFGSKYINSVATVEDLVQEILINIWNKKDYSTLRNLKAYLYASVKNKCLSHIKNNKLGHLEEMDLNWETDLFIQEDNDDTVALQIKKIKSAISKLPAGSREVFNTVVISGYKYKEAAEELNVSVNTIKTQLKRAYRMIEKNLGAFLTMISSLLG